MHEVASPVFERTTRAISLQELRGVSLELRPSLPADPPRFRREANLSRQPFFTKSQAILGMKGLKSEASLNRRSNFNYNYCVQNDESKVIGPKLKVKKESPYLRLKAGNWNPEIVARCTNKELFK